MRAKVFSSPRYEGKPNKTNTTNNIFKNKLWNLKQSVPYKFIVENFFSRNEGGGFYLTYALYELCVQLYKVVKFRDIDKLFEHKCDFDSYEKYIK